MAKLNGAASAKLASSGLTPAHGAKLHMEQLTADEVALLAKKYKTPWGKVDALKIPYFGFDGKPSKFWRLRFLGDTRPPGFAQATDSKATRYVQPAGDITEVYIPPLLAAGDHWGKVVADPLREVLITEGELKAAAAMAQGLPPCIGLGGASNYQSAANNAALLPMLDVFEWKGRRVTIVFDSDATQNINVEHAQYKLAGLLTGRGAKVYVGSLPAASDGAKQGLDDYLLKNSAQTFREQVLAPAQPLAEATALHAFNSRFAFILNPGFVVNLASGQEMASEKFVKYIHGDETYTVPVPKIDSEKVVLKTKRTAVEWIGWAPRKKYKCMTYAPGKLREYGGMYNLWNGWGCEPKKGDVVKWHELLAYQTGEEAAAWLQWVEQWYAYPVQFPGTKLHTSLVLFSAPQGTGKSLLGESMQQIYGDNWVKIKERDLSANHNEWAVNRQFVMGEELSSGEMRKVAIGDILKDLITQNVVNINKKYIPMYSVPDCMNYQLNTNHPDAFYLEDSDRRFGVNRVTRAPLPFSFYREYGAWVRSPEGASALHYHLLHVDLKGFDPYGSAPDTVAKRAMKSIGRTGLGEWVIELRNDPHRALPHHRLDLVDMGTLLMAFDPSGSTRINAQTMGRELQRQNMVQACDGVGVVLPTGKKQTLYILRNREMWLCARPAEAAAHMAGRTAAVRAPKQLRK